MPTDFRQFREDVRALLPRDANVSDEILDSIKGNYPNATAEQLAGAIRAQREATR